MIHDALPDHPVDVCIVGAGPVGIATALACEARGLRVLLLESGRLAPDVVTGGLSAADRVDPAVHAPMEIAVCRALGGTSRWWGGRCVPLDDVDFADRPHVPDARWPIDGAALRPWHAAAADFLGCGPARFIADDARWGGLGEIRADALERWLPEIDMGRRHRARLTASALITVVLGATVTGLGLDGDRVGGLCVATGVGGMVREVAADRYVLACGGLETTRLLLIAQSSCPSLFGGADGALGRFYMGHVSGKLAEIVLADPDDAAALDFSIDDGVYARRRFQIEPSVQMAEGLLNAAFWIDNPPFHAAGHGSALLSAAWLALAIPVLGRRLASEGIRRAHVGSRPYAVGRHLRNGLAGAPAAALDLVRLLRDRYVARPRKPGFLLRNRAGRYALHYHAEQSPQAGSRVCLGAARDALGMPRLDIGYRFAEADVDSVVRSHAVLDRALRRAGVGRLELPQAPEMQRQRVWAQAADGFHQIGTTRMGSTRRTGVVDADCRVHDLPNLFIASSSVFCSSGQANPTFGAVALGLRLADRLANMAEARPAPARAATAA